jgi:hypothetical protein
MSRAERIKEEHFCQIKYMANRGRTVRQIYACLAMTMPKRQIPNLKKIASIIKSKKRPKYNTKVTAAIISYILESTQACHGTSSSFDISKDILRLFNKSIDSSTIRIIRRAEGLVYRRLRKAPNLTEAHRLMRYLWCLRNYNTDFSKYLFVDETTVKVMELPYYHVRPIGSRPHSIACTSKYRLKLNVFGGISSQGATPFAVFTKNMDSYLYKSILDKVVAPFFCMNPDYKLHQDNDTKHCSYLCTNTLIACKINWVCLFLAVLQIVENLKQKKNL